MTKRSVMFCCLILALAWSLTMLWRWYQTPYAEINPVLWQDIAITYPAAERHQTLWFHRRHASRLKVSEAFLQTMDGKQIAVHLQSVSFPTLYPNAIKVDFELVDPADSHFLAKQKRAVVKQQY